MTIIRVPKTPASAFNKNRPVSSLLKTQLEHLQRAEFRLPAELQTNIYINAIKTEGEAAEYIGEVTRRLHAAHARGTVVAAKPKTRRVATIAAMAAPMKKKKRASAKAKSRTQRATRNKRKG